VRFQRRQLTEEVSPDSDAPRCKACSGPKPRNPRHPSGEPRAGHRRPRAVFHLLRSVDCVLRIGTPPYLPPSLPASSPPPEGGSLWHLRDRYASSQRPPPFWTIFLDDNSSTQLASPRIRRHPLTPDLDTAGRPVIWPRRPPRRPTSFEVTEILTHTTIQLIAHCCSTRW